MRLVILQGLPGSGKTTLAQTFIEEEGNGQWVRVNKDSIRQKLEASGWIWSQSKEEDVKKIRDAQITSALQVGMNVISDDTNFGKHPAHLRLLGKRLGAQVELLPVELPVEECILRDDRREGKARVGEEVIRQMWCRYLAPTEYHSHTVEWQPMLPLCILCDLDGTLCLHNGRNPYDGAKCGEDEMNVPVAQTLKAFERYGGYQIIYLSGRDAKWREQTSHFFEGKCLPNGPVYMRSIGDNRTDWVVKGELFDKYVRGKYNVLFVLDDRDQVVEFWRSIGLTVFQVAKGDF